MDVSVQMFFELFVHTLGFWWIIIPAMLLGLIVGAIPGFSAANTIIILLPLEQGEGDWSFHTLFEPHDYVRLRLALFALTVGYIAVISFLGFTITTFLFLFLAMLLLNRGRRAKLSFSLAAMLSIGGYLLFIVAFDTSFPEGPFEILMDGIL